jgi:hypothetical protein
MRNPSRAAAPTRAVNRSFRVWASRTPAWLHGAAALSSLIAIAGCSAPPGALADDDGVDVPEYLGPQPNGTGTTQPPGSTTPNATGAGGTGGNTSPVTPANNANEQTGSSNTPLTPSGNAGSANNGSADNSGNTGNPNQGAGGSSMVPPPPANQGAGGSSMVGNDDGNTNNGNTDPNTPPVEPPPTNNPPVTPPPDPVIDTDCPDAAFFCSGFEQTTFPAGTTNIIGGTPITDAFQLDASDSNSGGQSLLLPLTNQAFSYRVMAIDVPVQAFWARVFVKTDTLIGDNGHDGLFAISSGDRTVDNNNETRVEFSEQEGTIVLNRSTDQITFPIVRPTTLPANTWHCIETRFDGNAGDIEVFANGQAIIRSLANAQFRFQVKTFRIGTLQFHEPRTNRFDDVVLSTDRVGCN